MATSGKRDPMLPDSRADWRTEIELLGRQKTSTLEILLMCLVADNLAGGAGALAELCLALLRSYFE